MLKENEAEVCHDSSHYEKTKSDYTPNYGINTQILQRNFRVSLFLRQDDADAKHTKITWEDFIKRIEKPIVRAAKNGEAFSPTFFEPNHRSQENARELSMLVFDIDDGNLDLEFVKAELDKFKVVYAIHSSHSHRRVVEKKNPNAEKRWRVILPLEKPIPAESFDNVWTNINNFFKQPFDTSCRDTARLYFKPSKAAENAIYEYYISEFSELLRWEDYFVETRNEPKENPTDVICDDGFQTFLSKLSNVKQPSKNQWTACCPSHDDRNPSLAVTKGDNGGIIVFCHSNKGCTFESIFKAVGMDVPRRSEDQKKIEIFTNEQPTPLPGELLEVEKLLPEMLPKSLQSLLVDISERMCVPLEFAVTPCLAALSAVIARNIQIKPKRNDSWLVIPNLWGLTVANSGKLKSPPTEEILKPLKRLQAIAYEDYEAEIKDYLFNSQIIDAQKKQLQETMRKDKDLDNNKEVYKSQLEALEKVPPTPKRYLIYDATVEKMIEIMRDNPQGILQYRDEIAGWLASFNRSGHEGDREFYLSAWNGRQEYVQDRIGRGTVRANITLSVFGSIQPNKLRGFIRDAVQGTANDDGLLQRFQVAFYTDDIPYKYIDRAPIRDEKIFMLWEEIEQIEETVLSFSDDGQELFAQWLTELELRLRKDDEHPALMSHLAKYRSLMPSLAGIFYVVDIAARRTGAAKSQEEVAASQDAAKYNEIPAYYVEMAAAWCDLLETHARRIYGLATNDEIFVANRILLKLSKGEIRSPLTAREIYRRQLSGLTEIEKVKKSLILLAEFGWLLPRQSQSEQGGRIFFDYIAHPACFEKQ